MKMNFISQTILCIILIASSLSYSQITELQVERISIESGLSQSSILTICQDRRGFLWFGTYEGLNRFDGYQFKVYKNDPADPNSLGKNSIEFIMEDHLGLIWIGTEDGLNCFDPQKEQFVRYKNNPNDSTSLSSNYARYVYEDNEGVVWIGTNGGGLNRFDRTSEKFISYVNQPDNPKSISQNNILSILEDRHKRLWVGTDKGLNLFDREKGEFVRYLNDPKNPYSISHNSVWRIYEDKGGNLWLGTWGGGLNLFDEKTNRFIRYQNNQDDVSSLSNDVVRSIIEDRLGNLWVGTNGGGLNKLPRESVRGGNNQFITYRNNANDAASLSGDAITAVYEDQGGILWIGTNFRGINKYNPSKNQFAHYKSILNNPNSIPRNSINAVYEDSKGMIWIGTGGGGLSCFDRRINKFTHYTHHPNNPNSLSNNSVRCIFEDRRQRLWIGTDNGLNYFDLKTQQFTRFQNEPGNPHSISHNNAWCITEDLSGNLWVGTFGGGLNKFDVETKKFKRYTLKPETPLAIDENFIWTIHRDSAGALWIGTLSQGLNRFDPKNGSCIRYVTDSKNFNTISDNKVLSLYEDNTGAIWVGTTNGLNKFNRKDQTFRRYSVRDGLPNNSIQSIQQDDRGNLWISTNNGLTKLNPATGLFKNYFESYGLQSNEFSVNACFKTRNGEMIFGGVNGFNIFHPDSIRDDLLLPPIVITDFQVFNRPVHIAEEVEGETILQQSIVDGDNITLSYKHNVFSFEFAALHFASPKDNLYAYMMEGFDKEWNHTKANRRFATYTNLPPGKYTFRVKASNNQGAWNEQGISLSVTVTPPYWQSLWFKLAIALAGLIIVFGSYKRWRYSQKLAEEHRMEKALAKERHLLRTLIDNLPDAIYVKDIAARKVIANTADVQNMGYQYENEVIGKTDFDLFPKEIADGFFEDDQSVIQTGQPIINREERFYEKNGIIHWQLTTKLPLRNEDGVITGLVGIGRNITEQKLAAETLRNERNLFRTVIDNIPDYVYVKDTEGRFIIANSATIRQLGFVLENDLLGKTDFDFSPRETAENIYADEQKILHSGKSLFDFEGPIIDKTKELKDRWITTTKVPLKDMQGIIIGTVGIGRDITERKRVEEEREILIKDLQNALSDVKTLSGLVPICSNCKKIRDDSGYWNQLESFIQKHSQAKFSHGICPDCMKELYPEIKIKLDKTNE